jgi:hypothetical protein
MVSVLKQIGFRTAFRNELCSTTEVPLYCHLKQIGKNQFPVKYNDVHEFILFGIYCDSLVIFISVMAIAE